MEMKKTMEKTLEYVDAFHFPCSLRTTRDLIGQTYICFVQDSVLAQCKAWSSENFQQIVQKGRSGSDYARTAEGSQSQLVAELNNNWPLCSDIWLRKTNAPNVLPTKATTWYCRGHDALNLETIIARWWVKYSYTSVTESISQRTFECKTRRAWWGPWHKPCATILRSP